ncbi:hypothetical protein F2Q68_00035258 [Brassica cretica]|uniref:Uncharacterized protein n=1 Tax=Brassica cretica TaxID=69181 RepID=A0A8S9H599_BRACR|nr:hypothetical protein F2Q68_00035258 [Brassica cretica]
MFGFGCFMMFVSCVVMIVQAAISLASVLEEKKNALSLHDSPLRKRSSSKNRLRKSSFKKAVAGAYAPIDQEEGESSRQRNKKPCSTCHKSETFKGEKQMNQASIVGQMEKAFRQSMIPLGSAAAESKEKGRLGCLTGTTGSQVCLLLRVVIHKTSSTYREKCT